MSKPVEMVKMDSRKFLGQLNESAQAKVAFFEGRIQEMGAQAGKNWRLAALHAKELFIEDVDTHTYYVAEHARDHGKVNITNIRPIQIVEGEKQELFSESAYRLINALESNDQKEMAAAFNRLKSQRFSSRVVPESGTVRCRDGVLRRITISKGESLDEGVKDRLVSCLVESLRDRVVVENGHVTSATFGEEEVRLPVTKWAVRKLVAKRMMESAKDAYWSQGFQSRIYTAAKLVNENKIEEAVKSLSGFLNEMEEFTLLTRAQTQTLIENTLAAKAVFNQQLCDDVATLFYRTNIRVNKSKIVEEWKSIAQKSEHPVLAENVNILENAKNFEAKYDQFLKMIFEAISNREVAAEALATTLDVLRNKTPKIKESHELSSKLSGLINRLKQRDFDDAAIYEAEDLIATIQEELGAAETLGNFDQIPGDMAGMDQSMGGDMAGGAGQGAPVININSPLIQIGGSSAAGGDPAVGDQTPAVDPAAAGGDPELDALLGGGTPQAPAGAPPAPAPAGAPPAPGAAPGAQPLMQGLDRSGDLLAETYNDPYAIRDGESVVSEGLRFTDYGAPVITDEGDLDKIIRIMRRLATEHKLTGKALSENLENMAKASIKAIGLRIPQGKLPKALEQCVNAFAEEWEKPWLKKEKKETDNSDEDCCDDDESVDEDQYKIPVRRPRGFARSNLEREAPKSSRSGSANEGHINVRQAIAEGITWSQKQDDAILGEMAGVQFIFDHGGDSNLEPVILSEDGSVEIPVPNDLFEEAFAAANMTEGDGSRFVNWLANSLEQLRPISAAEDRALEEAVAKITAGPDGSLSVEVTPDVEVETADQGDGLNVQDGEMSGGMDDGMMAPVDTTEPQTNDQPQSAPTGGGSDGLDPNGGEEQMPDFEAQGGDMGTGAPPEPAPKQNVKPAAGPGNTDDDGVHFEDKDFTSPASSKYTAPLKDNKRKMPEVKVPGKTTDKLDGIGPELKVDNGSGTNPPTAKKGSDE